MLFRISDSRFMSYFMFQILFYISDVIDVGLLGLLVPY
ncbi:unnamed protein product [Brassica oleracea var. botrytis]